MRVMIAAGLSAACLMPAAAQDAGNFGKPYWVDKPVLEALGRADLQLEPNRASFSVSYKDTATSAEEALKKAVQKARSAYKAMKDLAGEEVTVTSSVNVTAYYEQYETEDNRIVENRRADKIAGYEASVSLSVKTSDVPRAGELRAAALALGPDWSSQLSTTLERTGEMLIDAQKAAIADAKRRAEVSADAAGVTLGKLLVVQEGYGPCLGEWTNGTGNYYSAASPPPPPPPPPPPAPSSQDSYAQTITVSPEDIAALNLPSDTNPIGLGAAACLVYEIG